MIRAILTRRSLVLCAVIVLLVVAVFLLAPASPTVAVPQYYTGADYYAEPQHLTLVGGWRSCPPSEGGYVWWGVSGYGDYFSIECPPY